jgi:hypothetical protein
MNSEVESGPFVPSLNCTVSSQLDCIEEKKGTYAERTNSTDRGANRVEPIG